MIRILTAVVQFICSPKSVSVDCSDVEYITNVRPAKNVPKFLADKFNEHNIRMKSNF